MGPHMENIKGGKTAPSKSAAGPIWLGHGLIYKIAQKTCSVRSFSLFTLNFKYKFMLVMVSISFFFSKSEQVQFLEEFKTLKFPFEIN